MSYLFLVILALVDSTSIGTLVVPVLLLVVAHGSSGGAGRPTTGALYYLAVVGTFYWILGLTLTAGALPLFDRFGDALTSPTAMAVYTVIGVLLVVWSFRIDPKAVRKRGGDPDAGARRWAGRVSNAGTSYRALTGLALLAGAVEAATMVPYVAAIGIIVDSGAGLGTSALFLAAYCLVMILPAALLALGRALGGARLDTVLNRVNDWGVRNAAGAFSWTVGIVGVLVVLHTAPVLLQHVG